MYYPQLAEEFSKKVRKIIKDRNTTIDIFACECHIDRATMYDIVKGKHNMQDFNLLKICLYGNIPVEQFCDGCLKFVTDEYDRRKGGGRE